MEHLRIIIAFLSISVFFSCSKFEDNLFIPSENFNQIDNRNGVDSSAINYLEFFQAFASQKNSVIRDSITLMNPLWYDLDTSSATTTYQFGVPSIIVNAEYSPFVFKKWYKNQIIIKKLSANNFEINTLLYIADSSHYSINNWTPKLISFTGDVLEYRSDETAEYIYNFLIGEITGIDDIQALQIDPDLDCPDWGTSWWERFTDWISGINIGGFGGGGGSSSGGSGNFGGITIIGFGGGGFGETWGSNSTGNGGSNNLPLCEDPSGFWGQYDPIVKKII